MGSFEFRKYSFDDIGVAPKIFANENDGFATAKMIDMYGSLFVNGEGTKPIFFIRHGNYDSYRFGSIFEPSDDPNGLQKPLHDEDMAQKDTEVGPYSQLGPDVWGYGTEEPFSEYRFYADHATYKEGKDGCIYDLVATPWPNCLFRHADESSHLPSMSQPVIYSGTYEGKPVTGVGFFERIFAPQHEARDFGDIFAYCAASELGIREDGRKEQAMINMGPDGKAVGFYWLEGEEPVQSDNVEVRADWYHQPYVNDGTITYKDIVYRFAGKEIHFEGKYGLKGITAKPRLNKTGQSQMFGTWYEGSTPYKHKTWMTFQENMGISPELIAKIPGFKIID